MSKTRICYEESKVHQVAQSERDKDHRAYFEESKVFCLQDLPNVAPNLIKAHSEVQKSKSGLKTPKKKKSADNLKTYHIVFRKQESQVDKVTSDKRLSSTSKTHDDKGEASNSSQNESRLSSFEENVLRKKKISKKQKNQALQYLKESRRNLKLQSNELHSGFSQRIKQKQQLNRINQLRQGEGIMALIPEVVPGKQFLKELMSEEQLKQYKADQKAILQKERSRLSKFRFQKMRGLICAEMHQIIPEALFEPEASILEQQSITEQNRNDILKFGCDKPNLSSEKEKEARSCSQFSGSSDSCLAGEVPYVLASQP